MSFLRLCVPASVLVFALHAQTLERAEALWTQGRDREANDAFRAAVAANPKNPDYRVRWGRFFLESFQPKDAEALFKEALAIRKDHGGALMGLALVAAEGFDTRAAGFARRALTADPKLLEAQELLARLALEDNDHPRAIAEADKALAMSPDALDAMAIRATIDWLEDKPETPWLKRVMERNPHYGKAYETAGRFFVLNRRYEEGIRFYRKAVELSPELWSARSQLGINLMRLGHEDEARKHLEACFENGHRDPATRNTLKLLDSYANFETFKTENTILKLHKKESALLRPYFEGEMKRSISTFEKKYGLKLDRPVQVEVYPDHGDFEVRTLGMPGLGALGVTFGYVVAMDSPSGRKPGTFHWASTLWHEMSHVFVLAATKHKAPRWFTEGMAVHEETAVSPEWGDRLGPEVITAIREKKLLPVSDLDRGFVRPAYPAQVLVSYFQAGRICDYINREWGFAKLLAMMHDFGRGEPTARVVEKQLGISPAEFDERFLAALDAETRKTVTGFEEWSKRLKQVAALAREKRHEDVIREAAAIRDIYPEYVEPGSAYEFLAEAHLARNEKPAAMAELDRYARAGGRDPELLKKLAALLEEAGQKQQAADALERLNYIYPGDEELHGKLGALWLDAGNHDGAIREYRAALARAPIDPAAAHYNLARAYRAAKRDGDARDELLLALETAPGFRPAQKLLLELSK
ncbi:MAG TPA: tetratricopeptide repeat protein [Bryobacteraceae bacterium]|nr:tetratricopeptide repeat protein [Bryobacteraceae bacterium]